MPAAARSDGRFLFLVPWRTCVHPRHEPRRASRPGPARSTVTAADLEAFLAEGRRAFPRASLTHGRRPARAPGTAADDVRQRERTSRSCARARSSTTRITVRRGCVSIHGVRYTTARDTAAAGGGCRLQGAWDQPAAGVPQRPARRSRVAPSAVSRRSSPTPSASAPDVPRARCSPGSFGLWHEL